MARIVTYETPTDFLRANRNYIYDDYYAHYHLIHVIEQLKRRTLQLRDCYNVIDDDGSNVLCMWVIGGYYIYSKGWNDSIVELLVDKVELHKFTHYSFCGQRELIKQLFKLSDIEGEVFKNRFIEVCDEVNQPIFEFSGEGKNAQMDDFEELVQMAMDYHREEFRGEGSQTFESISASTYNSIEGQSLYVWRAEGEIVSVAQHINNDDEFAMIGSLYTKPEFRGRGYAYCLLHTVTKGLLEAGFLKCGLVSDADNEITKKIFERIGYTPVYNWVLMRKEN